MRNQNLIIIFGLIVLLAVGAFFIFNPKDPNANKIVVANFEECKNAGYPVMESYPSQCRDAWGNNYVEIIVNPNPTSTTTPNPTPTPNQGSCYIGGCSGQICSDQKGMVSTCEYREEYACYKTAKCERQVSGKCGWTQTSALLSCLNSSTRVAAGYLVGHVTIGPFCPVEREGEPCKTPESAYTSREAIVYAENTATVIDRVNLDKNGNYNLTLGPGKYYVQIDPAGIGKGEKKYAVIKSFETTTINFDIDTGIR